MTREPGLTRSLSACVSAVASCGREGDTLTEGKGHTTHSRRPGRNSWTLLVGRLSEVPVSFPRSGLESS